MLMSSSAGSLCTGDTRHRSSYSRRMAASYERSADTSAPSDDCESFGWIMKESLSSSGPRSGEVEVELDEDELDRRSNCRDRDMAAVRVRGGEFCKLRDAFVDTWESLERGRTR